MLLVADFPLSSLEYIMLGVSAEKSADNLMGVPCVLFVAFLLMLQYFVFVFHFYVCLLCVLTRSPVGSSVGRSALPELG